MRIMVGEGGERMAFTFRDGGGGFGMVGGPPPIPPEERARMEHRLSEVIEQAQEAKAAGQRERAEQLGREVQEIKSRLAGPKGGMMGFGGGMGGGGMMGGGFGVVGPMMNLSPESASGT